MQYANVLCQTAEFSTLVYDILLLFFLSLSGLVLYIRRYIDIFIGGNGNDLLFVFAGCSG